MCLGLLVSSLFPLLVGRAFAGGNIPFGLSPAQNVPVPRVISRAYYASWSGPVYTTAGMSMTGYTIPATGVNNGDLLLIIANIDNGSDTVWPNPVAPGFTNLAQKFYGNDGQTYVAAWKFANNEPASYTGTYGGGIISASATISLIAVTGASPVNPIAATSFGNQSGTSTTTATGASTGVTTTSANNLLIYASGGDWESDPTTVTWTLPTGYASLDQFGDRGGATVDWTANMVGYRLQPGIGASGAVSGKTVGTSNGLGWYALIAIRP